MASASIFEELSRFAGQQQSLQKLYQETKLCMSEVDYNDQFDEALLRGTILDLTQQNQLHRLLDRPAAFIFLGCSAFAKAAVVNDLIGGQSTVLPTTVEGADAMYAAHSMQWRNIKIRYTDLSFDSCSSFDMDSVSGVSPAVRIRDLQQNSFRDSIESHSSSRSGFAGDLADTITIRWRSPILSTGAEVWVPEYLPSGITGTVQFCMENTVPVFIYVFNHSVTEKDIDDLTELRQAYPSLGLFFVKSATSFVRADLPESDRYAGPKASFGIFKHGLSSPAASDSEASSFFGSSESHLGVRSPKSTPSNVVQHLRELGYLAMDSEGKPVRVSRRKQFGKDSSAKDPHCKGAELRLSGGIKPPRCYYIERSQDLSQLTSFVRPIFRAHFLELASKCYDTLHRQLILFILTAFDMSRDQLITPKRLAYARLKEADLYKSLMDAVALQQDRVRGIIADAIVEHREALIQASVEWEYKPQKSNQCNYESLQNAVQVFILSQLSKSISDRLNDSLQCLKQTFVDTLGRCVRCLEYGHLGVHSMTMTASMTSNSSTFSKLSFVNKTASDAYREILNAAYNVEISLQCSSGSLFQMFLEKIRNAISKPHRATSIPEYQSAEHQATKQKIAMETLNRLNDMKVARHICAQLRERIKSGHENFVAALEVLEMHHISRLERTEKQRLCLRKQHAPRFARLTMECLALRDSYMFGMPKLGVEIGRGQYGVVFACDQWGPLTPCAVKSVVPPDDKHWNDLALEFFYTKSLPEHPRIVRLHGAVVDHNYAGGGGLPAVLLIMERMKRDLYTAIRAGLSWPARLRLAMDVVDGIRFLHSQGLVHRDIKLKNVLLDDSNRGKITDLGFCKPEAMMSGSVVGTPIHMAPELFSGGYDNSVDVYAFGVLFWYICAGHVRLPQAFEACYSKDQLWCSVRKGTRPENLAHFDIECWDIMSSCWSGDPANRPHLGSIQPRLERLLENYLAANGEDDSTA